MNQKLTALIITYNEANNICDALACLNFADEIIIVDSFSTDDTVQLALSQPKVKVYQHHFEDFTKQRNLALSYANNDWIIFLDECSEVSMRKTSCPLHDRQFSLGDVFRVNEQHIWILCALPHIHMQNHLFMRPECNIVI